MGWLNIEDEGKWQIWFLIAGYGHVWLMDSGMLGVGCLELEDMDQDPFDRGIGSCGFGACMDSIRSFQVYPRGDMLMWCLDTGQLSKNSFASSET
jgi:hypothetical protein